MSDQSTRPWFKKKRFILLLVPIVSMGTIQADNYGGDDTGTLNTAESCTQRTATGAPRAEAVAAIGTKVRDGKFEFVVAGVEHPGKTFPGKLHTLLTARGEFVIVRVDVTNIGDEAKPLDYKSQFLLSDKGQTLEPSSATLLTRDALEFVQQINPGNTLKGAPVLFDVAPGTKIVNIELHDTSCSQGVKVRLS
jgi:hypothetical protein